MKKSSDQKIDESFFIVIIIFFTVVLFYILKSFFNPTEVQYSSRLIHEYIPKNIEILQFHDTHGGFHGDGTLYAVYQFDPKSYEIFFKKIQKNNKWKSLPFEQNESFLSGIYNREGIYKIPKNFGKGFYYFKDRYNKDDGKISEIYLSNYTFSVFDLETMRLYIVDQDT